MMQPRVVELALDGELDVTSTAELRHVITSQLLGRPDILVLDVAEVTFLDCAGLSGLIWARNYALSLGLCFALARPSRAVRQVLAATQTAADFHYHEDPQETMIAVGA